jgi:ABC-2 type transport system permease protein
MSDTTAALPAHLSPPRTGLRDDLRLAASQVVFEQRAFWRSKGAAFFMFALPLTLILVFASAHNGGVLPGQGIPYDDYLLPGLLAYGLVMSTFANIAVGLAMLRDLGVLKRVRVTPLPVWAFIAGRIGSALVTALLISAISVGLGELVFSTDLRLATLPGLALTLALGTLALSALGVAALRIMGSGDTARIVINVIVLPLTFISRVWGPQNDMPSWLDHLARLFPLEHVAAGLQHAFDPRVAGPGIAWSDMAALAIWAVIGAVLARGVLQLGRE